MRQVRIKGTNQIREFPDEMGDDQIKSVLQQEFVRPTSAVENVSAQLAPQGNVAEPYQPSMAEGMKNKIAQFLMDQGIISDRFGAQQIGENLSTLLQAAPAVGDVSDASDLAQAVSQGNTTESLLAGAGFIPLAGEAVQRFARSSLNERLQAKIDADWQRAFDEYAQNPETKGGRLINTDEARELSPEYRNDKTLAGEVHEASSKFTKQVYDKLLNEPVMEGARPIVRFTAGGAGSGKSTALKGDKFPYEVDITYDTTLSKGASDAKKVEKALDTGRTAQIVHVYRDPVEAFENGVITRGKNLKDKPNGRIVPIKEVAKNHIGARDSINYMAERYGDDPRVSMYFYDNSRGRDKGDFVGSVNELPEFNYTPEQLESEFTSILDRKLSEGFIDQATYDKYLGK